MTALLTDNLPLLAGAPNGIKKLRELILELAVRGKLVPQDPSDEPASELLKRIAEEKARLVTEGKIKKQKALPKVDDESKQFDLPAGWEWARLGSQVLESGAGWSPSCESRPRKGSEWGVLKVSAVSWGVFRPEENKALPANLDARPEHEVSEGDFLVSRANTAELVAKSVVVEAAPSNLMLSDKIVRLKLTSLCERRYVNLVNSAPLARAYYSQVAGGTSSSMKNVSREQILNLPLALPPLAEQHRIVAKVDELMALCDRLEARQADADSAHAQLVQALLDSLTQARDAEDFAQSWQRLAEHFHTLFTTESSSDALKQTLLQLAVMGKLVPQNPSDEPASELLKGIQSSRVDKRKIVMLAEDSPVVEQLPESWAWSSIDQLSADDPRAITDGPFGANLKTEHYIDTPGFRVIRLQNIGNGEFRNEHLAYISQEQFEKIIKHQVFPGDLLIAGLIDTSIRCCSAPEDIGPAVVKADCYRFSVHPLVSPKYALYYLNSKVAHEFAAIHHHGLTLTRIGLGNFRSIPVALPPTAEQHRIVAKVDQLMALCDKLKARLSQVRQVHEQLANALVEQAVA